MAPFDVPKLTLSIFDFAVNSSYVILVFISNKKLKKPPGSLFIFVYTKHNCYLFETPGLLTRKSVIHVRRSVVYSIEVH